MEHVADPRAECFAPERRAFAAESLDLGESDAGYQTKLPLALTFILFTLFLPQGLSFFIAGLRLTVTRVIFLVLAPVLFMGFGKKIGTGAYKFVWADLFVFLTSFWMFLGPAVTSGISDSLVHSGPVVLEYLIAYLSTRVLLSGPDQVRRFVGRACFVIAVVSLSGILDSITGRYFIWSTVSILTGHSGFIQIGTDQYRFGLLRAAGPVEHSILYGFVSTLGFLLSLTMSGTARKFCTISCFVGVVLSFSSAAEQCVVMGLGLLFYNHLFRGLRYKWLLLSVAPVSAAVFLFFATPTPFGHLIDLLTIDSGTAYYRLYIWNMVGPVILESPWFGVLPTPGVGYEGSVSDVGYEGSVDSLWLVLSLTYGMPCAILTGLSMIGACSVPTDVRRARLTREESHIGTTLGIITFLIIFMGFTVHFWGETWVFIGLLAGVRARLGELGQLAHVVPGGDWQPDHQ